VFIGADEVILTKSRFSRFADEAENDLSPKCLVLLILSRLKQVLRNARFAKAADTQCSKLILKRV
jgi:hypothetical protein